MALGTESAKGLFADVPAAKTCLDWLSHASTPGT